MTKVAITVILSSLLLAFGCGESDGGNSEMNIDDARERARCSAKCDDFITKGLKIVNKLELVEVDGETRIRANALARTDWVFVDFEIDGEVTETVMHISDDGKSFQTREGFELPAYDKFNAVAYGLFGERRYEQNFEFSSDSSVAVDLDPAATCC